MPGLCEESLQCLLSRGSLRLKQLTPSRRRVLCLGSAMAAATSEPAAAAETKVAPGPTLLYSVLVGQRVFIWRTNRRKFFPATVVRAWTSPKARAVGVHTRARAGPVAAPLFLFLTPPPLSVGLFHSLLCTPFQPGRGQAAQCQALFLDDSSVVTVDVGFGGKHVAEDKDYLQVGALVPATASGRHARRPMDPPTTHARLRRHMLRAKHARRARARLQPRAARGVLPGASNQRVLFACCDAGWSTHVP